ncbi:hypothetical protein [Polycladidibacter stylochi]|uniref:hypothetical protein n=1 Tax=Polycladidibacter stylochi TaxID=1807766 RepID=UPI000A511041|nr:hypothetical protein [Pseudovibrio stylochi]
MGCVVYSAALANFSSLAPTRGSGNITGVAGSKGVHGILTIFFGGTLGVAGAVEPDEGVATGFGATGVGVTATGFGATGVGVTATGFGATGVGVTATGFGATGVGATATGFGATGVGVTATGFGATGDGVTATGFGATGVGVAATGVCVAATGFGATGVGVAATGFGTTGDGFGLLVALGWDPPLLFGGFSWPLPSPPHALSDKRKR